MTPREKTHDTHLRLKFGKSLAWYYETLEKQNFGCAICGRPVVNYSLAADHMHAFDMCKVRTEKIPDGRKAFAVDPFGVPAEAFGKTAPLAIKNVKMILRERSVRGLLCMTCNRGIGFFATWIDGHFTESPDLLDRATRYVKQWCYFLGRGARFYNPNLTTGLVCGSVPSEG
jgi:hypothetical protein